MAVSLDRLFAFAHPAHTINGRPFAMLTDATFAVAVVFHDATYARMTIEACVTQILRLVRDQSHPA